VTRLTADAVTLAYDSAHPVVDGLSLAVPEGQITCIIGPNGCGKSTLLRALARLLRPTSGAVLLDGRVIHRLPTKQVARRVGLLPQAPVAPQGLTVTDLVARGRFPHRRLFDQWSPEDEAAVEQALTATSTQDLRDRRVDELSGGQRQRVWIAMALAQRTAVLLLDEPTTHLDVAHQLEVLELLAELNVSGGRTIVMVLHDLNEAARYGHHLVAMRAGRIVAAGPPEVVVTAETVRAVFGIDSHILTDPVTGGPLLVPVAQKRARPEERARELTQ
jgi:iron complex transport system ATP-binding protein